MPASIVCEVLDIALDDTLTVAENVARFAPKASHNTIRAWLARFLFRGSRADQLLRTVSGGERFRAPLAALLLAEPPPQLLILDEPTNNLDMASVRQLSTALEAYRGALIVASHDSRSCAPSGPPGGSDSADQHLPPPCMSRLWVE